jgi:hypothetical protein
MNKVHDRNVRDAECITNEMLANSWLETAYHFYMCHATTPANIVINKAHKLCDVQCLKVY